SPDLWKSVFAPIDFFSRYKRYLRLDLEAQDMGALHTLQGLAESRLRSGVVIPLEKRSKDTNGYIEVLHTLARWYSPEDLGEEPPKDRCRLTLYVGYQTVEGYGSLDIADILRDYNKGLMVTGHVEKDQIVWSGVKASKLPDAIRPSKWDSKKSKKKKGKKGKGVKKRDTKEKNEGEGEDIETDASAPASS
ncbi:hypothetical protein KIPB_006576, partial [Kipferlia bialata]